MGSSSRKAGYQLGLLTLIDTSALAASAGRFLRVDLRYLPRVALIVASSLLSLPLRLAQALLYARTIRRTGVDEAPVFIIGHWRSGTTHLHNLMCQDDAFGYIGMHQAMFPSASLVGERWTRAVLRWVMPDRRPMDNMAFAVDTPQEEEVALTKSSHTSFYWQFVFPREARDFFRRSVLMHDVGARFVEDWKRAYMKLLRIATLRSNGRRLVLKNPANTARIPRLLELFPDAKFVFIHRSPYGVFPSTCNLHRKIMAFSAVQSVANRQVEANVFEFYEQALRKYLEDRSKIPSGNLVEMRLEDLERDPLGELRGVYAKLDLPGFERAQPAFAAYVDSQKSYRKNRFTLSAEQNADIERRWAFAFDAWGYERAPTPRGRAKPTESPTLPRAAAGAARSRAAP